MSRFSDPYIFNVSTPHRRRRLTPDTLDGTESVHGKPRYHAN